MLNVSQREVLELIEADDIKFVRLAFCDVFGKQKNIAIVAEGRLKDSKGITMTHLAEKMQGRGCRVAINMDGGVTSCMMFMGKQINRVDGINKRGDARKEAEFLAIGTSLLVEGYLPPEER